MRERLLNLVTGSLAQGAQRGCWSRLRLTSGPVEDRATRDRRRSAERLRYHLGRGRRAREAGRFACGAAEARKALRENPQSAWALALLGQCLTRQPEPDLAGARRALELAQALAPSNGYFVGLLLDVLDAQGDVQGRADALAWAWWSGAPVERWLPDGSPPRRAETPVPAARGADAVTAARRGWTRDSSALLAGRQPVGA